MGLRGARESLHLAAKVRLKKQRRKLAKKVVKAGCLEDISARSFVRGDGHDAFLSVMTRYWDLHKGFPTPNYGPCPILQSSLFRLAGLFKPKSIWVSRRLMSSGAWVLELQKETGCFTG